MPKGGKGKGKGKKGAKAPSGPNPRTLPANVRAAANGGDTAAVEKWLNDGGHVDATHMSPAYPDRSRTLLMIASRNGHEIFAGSLIERGALVNIQDSNGYTALMFAAGHGHPYVMKRLLWAGADPGIRNKLGHSPLDWIDERHAHSPTPGHSECIRLIEQHIETRPPSPPTVMIGGASYMATTQLLV